ncbi:hypothetical protein ACFX19_031638 [Malus domestica]
MSSKRALEVDPRFWPDKEGEYACTRRSVKDAVASSWDTRASHRRYYALPSGTALTTAESGQTPTAQTWRVKAPRGSR